MFASARSRRSPATSPAEYLAVGGAEHAHHDQRRLGGLLAQQRDPDDRFDLVAPVRVLDELAAEDDQRLALGQLVVLGQLLEMLRQP